VHFSYRRANPVSTYISLFGHGCSKLGGIYKGFKKRGLEDLYVPTMLGFERWLDFVLEPKNASLIKKKYAGTGLNDTCGLLTHRLMMLSFLDPLETLQRRNKHKVSGREGLSRFYNKNRIYDHYVRTEELADDFFHVLTSCSERVKLNFPLTTPEDLRARIPRKNIGAKIEGLTSDAVSEELRARVREYEWLIYETFGYDENAKGRPPPLPQPVTVGGRDRGAPQTWRGAGRALS
jgi:hypothetical protein